MFSQSIVRARTLAVAGGLALVAACAAPPPPRAVAPPPHVASIPARPLPPGGAAETTPIPAKGMDGVRQTVNAHISSAQATWNLRSAFNVAALNCMDQRHAAILDGYKNFLKIHKTKLSAVNNAVEKEWRSRQPSNYMRERDSYSTRVYNYFALPPVLPRFCDQMLLISNDSFAVRSADLDAFSSRSLTQIEAVFEGFYQDFERFRFDAAAWDARYGAAYGRRPSVSYYSPAPYQASN